ncbi:Retrovirus-related Pol polyprotein from transposon opus [Araneus ventricosus]|uniref:RNA-directed DNA polymerase n=1 Tax=Araneus ventricosus TaxID=182803 RepID=A0A4Y2IKP2_ARAVE|nr:Retrovirus-related Pol polyprotein from transposon opus [Araneus ventricosus]
MNPRYIQKTAVITPIGLSEYVFMTFGLRNAAQTMQRCRTKGLACLHSLVKNKVKKDNTPIARTEDPQSAFGSCKRLIANAIALTFPAADTRLSLKIDVSDFAKSAVLQQHTESKVEPIGFFSRKLFTTEKKYSTFDRELLSIYLSVKHFRYMLEGREVFIYTDHKPLVCAFTRKHDNSTPRQIMYLEHISQYTTDIRYISGRDNVVADTFSRIPQINLVNLNDFSGLAEDQFSDYKLQSLMGTGTGLELRPMFFASSEKPLYCDVSTGTVRPYVTKYFRRQIFNHIHNLSHPGVKATQTFVAARFVWKNMNKYCALW